MKKGFSLIALMTTVVVILILLSTATFSIINSSNISKKTGFATEINMIQQAVDAYKTKNDSYPSKNIVVIDLSSLNDKQKEQFINNGENIISNKLSLVSVDYQAVGITNLKYGTSETANDIYAISENSGKVYYVKGFKVGNDTYFTLTESLKNLLIVNKDKDLTNSGAPVVFEPTQTSYTNSDVSVKVKVPSTYATVSVYANNNIVPMSGSENGFNIYNVNESGNYTITVNYNEKTSVYNVANVDKISPVVEISSYQEITNPEDDIIGYYKITKNNDDLSGIKLVKYEEELFKDATLMKEHFEISGIVLDNNIIPVRKGVKAITLYVEDNAGNWTAQFIER